MKRNEELMMRTVELLLQSVAGKKLFDYLKESGYYSCPASVSFHGAKAGGLYKHSMKVYSKLEYLTSRLNLHWQRPESPAVIGLLHDVCKMDDYILCDKEGQIVIEKNPDRFSPGHGQKSLIMLSGYIDLTEEEKMCILFHMGSFSDSKEWEYYSKAIKKYPNVLYTHMADMIASQIEGV